MIIVPQSLPIARAGQAGAARGNSGTGFSLPSAKAGTTARSSAAGMAMPLDGLVALQAGEEVQERRKRQARRGNDLLDALDRLKAALLSGRVAGADLAGLRMMLSARRESTDDPRLDEVLAHIELRAEVELAKLGR